MNRKLVWVSLLTGLFAAACDDENSSTLRAFGMPGDMHVVEHCVLNQVYTDLNETACTQAGGTFDRTVYVANMSTATLAYVKFYNKSAEFESVDTTRAVPGVTSIAVGERPMSVAGDHLGALVISVSSIRNDLSVVSTLENREIVWQTIDKTPRKIIYNDENRAYYVFFADGTIRKLSVTYRCGDQTNVLTPNCKLDQSNVDLTWTEASRLEGAPVDFVAHPTQNIGYVSYSDKRYVSVVGFDDSTGACADGSSAYPCELRRIGVGFGCADGIDNNGDGKIDAEDASCMYPWSVEGASTESAIQVGYLGMSECTDGIDNNGNGLFDALDPGCVASNDASEDEGFQPMTLGTCADGIDNDGDGDADRDDIKCMWPTDDEDVAYGSHTLGVGLCRDNLDNDGDGKIDAEDSACYGKNGFGENDLVSHGRGPLAIDKGGKFLYVLDPVDSQLIVVDLTNEQTIDRSGWFPRNRVVGIPTARLALSLAADTRIDTVFNKSGHKVTRERDVVFVGASNGSVTEYLIHQKLTHTLNDVEVDHAEEIAMRASDTDDDASYIGVVRCIGRICVDSDLPTIDLRRRPAISYFSDVQKISDRNPTTGEYHSVIYDSIIASETWRIEFEGTLEEDERTDGYFDDNADFHTALNFCTIGAAPGDHLILTNDKGLKTLPQCSEFNGKNLEWEVTAAGPHALKLKPTGIEGDAPAPNPACFTSGLNFEVRAANQWLITSKSSYVNRRITSGNACIDDPRKPFGNMRFAIDPTPDAKFDTQTAFFSVKLPDNAKSLKRGDAYEFTTRTGQSDVSIAVGAAPTAMKLFKTSKVNFLLISEASANSLIIYDIDDESIDDAI